MIIQRNLIIHRDFDEGMEALFLESKFELVSKYSPQGDQPGAIETLVDGTGMERNIKRCLVQQEQGKHSPFRMY